MTNIGRVIFEIGDFDCFDTKGQLSSFLERDSDVISGALAGDRERSGEKYFSWGSHILMAS